MKEFLEENMLMIGLLFAVLLISAVWGSRSVVIDGNRAGKIVAAIIGVVVSLGLVAYILSESSLLN